MFEGLTLRAGPLMATLHPGLEARILFLSIEAGAVLVDVGQVTVAEDTGVGMCGLQLFQQPEKCAFLRSCPRVGRIPLLVQSAFVAYP